MEKILKMSSQQLSVEQEIENLVNKVAEDLKVKLVKIIERHDKKLLRETTAQLKVAKAQSKAPAAVAAAPVRGKVAPLRRAAKGRQAHSDSESYSD